MEKEIEGFARLKDVGWVGRLDCDSNTVIAEAYFRTIKVSRIVSTYLDLQGDMAKTLKIVNDDVRSDEEGYVKPEEITAIVDWASRNPTSNVVKL